MSRILKRVKPEHIIKEMVGDGRGYQNPEMWKFCDKYIEVVRFEDSSQYQWCQEAGNRNWYWHEDWLEDPKSQDAKSFYDRIK